MTSRSCSLMLLLALLGALAPASRVSAEDAACAALFEQAAAQLAAEQYPRMLRIANDRTCGVAAMTTGIAAVCRC